MEILLTPDDAADRLPDYPMERRGVEIPAGEGQGLRVHLIDAGDPDASVVGFLHGNPSWSYSWRHRIAAVGYTVALPDWLGESV